MLTGRHDGKTGLTCKAYFGHRMSGEYDDDDVDASPDLRVRPYLGPEDRDVPARVPDGDPLIPLTVSRPQARRALLHVLHQTRLILAEARVHSNSF